MKPTRFIPASLLLLMVACSQTSAPNDTSLSPQAVITVGGSCSLVDAIHAANRDASVGGCPGGSGRDTIRLGSGTVYTLNRVDNTTAGPNGLPSITSNVTITGDGTTIERSDAASTPEFRLFHVAATGRLTLQGVTVRKGDASCGSGGGISNSGRLVIENGVVTENSACDGGGVNNRGSLTVVDSLIAGNTSQLSGGGIFTYGNVELSNSVIRGNLAGSDGGGGIASFNGIVTLSESLIEENVTDADGGGLYIESSVVTIARSIIRNNISRGEGGGLYTFYYGEATLEASTVSGNRARRGGGAANLDRLMVFNSTISGNHGGGVYQFGNGGTTTIMLSTITANTGEGEGEGQNAGIERFRGEVSLYHSIVANQQGLPDCAANTVPLNISNEGFNLDSDGSCGLSPRRDFPNTDPRLGPLQDNGGPTETHALLPGSPAINVGKRELDPEFDQRGVGFPRIQEGVADLGAFESVSLSEPDTLCGIPEGLWGLLEHPALEIRFCDVIPEPCFWQLCEAPPFLKLLPLDPCITCGWKLKFPRETSLRLNFRIDAFAKDPKAFAEAFGFGLFTPEGKLIRQGKLTQVFDPQTKEVHYALGLEADLAKGNYVVSVEVLDKKLWDVMSKAPKDYPFEFGFPGKQAMGRRN